ncbi:tetratricopeptide repeat protein [Halieaceae bacterium]|nr:tetratricopeptide repeat protein [Halieaceae bacterium]
MDHRQRFLYQITQPDENIDLLEAALCIAAALKPEVDLKHTHKQLQQLAETARFQVKLHGSTEDICARLCDYIHKSQGFVGNDEDFYDPNNSFMDQVIERRQGIPITLALLYIHIGRSIGLDIRGLGFPGHFLVKASGDSEVVIDPFHGVVLDEADCYARLERASHPAELLNAYLAPISSKNILARILSNLKLIYMKQKDYSESLTCCEWRLLIDPDNAQDILDGAVILEKLECFDSAATELERLLILAPESRIAPTLRAKIASLRENNITKLH